MQIVVENNRETHEIQDPFTETYLLHCLCCKSLGQKRHGASWFEVCKGCIMILSWRICGSEPNNGWTDFFGTAQAKKNTEYIIYCKPQNMVPFWNSPYCTPYSNTMILGTSIFSNLLIFRFQTCWNKTSTPTPLKFNMEPENGPLQKEIPFGNHHFQVPC